MTTETLRDLALRLAKEAGFRNGGFLIGQEEIETLVHLAMAEGMERAANCCTGANYAEVAATRIRKMKEEL